METTEPRGFGRALYEAGVEHFGDLKRRLTKVRGMSLLRI